MESNVYLGLPQESDDSLDDGSRAGEVLRLLTDLSKNPGFLLLGQLVQQQIDNLQHDLIYKAPDGITGVIESERIKGKIEGRLVWNDLLQTAIENAKLENERFIKDREAQSEGV